MEGKNPFVREGNHKGPPPPHRLRGDRGAGSSGAEEVEVRANEQGDEDMRERWFRQENSRVEICTLTHLEDDLNTTLMFEHGGG